MATRKASAASVASVVNYLNAIRAGICESFSYEFSQADHVSTIDWEDGRSLIFDPWGSFEPTSLADDWYDNPNSKRGIWLECVNDSVLSVWWDKS